MQRDANGNAHNDYSTTTIAPQQRIRLLYGSNDSTTTTTTPQLLKYSVRYRTPWLQQLPQVQLAEQNKIIDNAEHQTPNTKQRQWQ